MKKIMLIGLMFCFVVSIAQAEIVKTQGEQKMANSIKSISSRLESAREDVTRVYNSAKTYIVDHPTQFDTGDKTKLNGLQTHILNVQNSVNDLITYVNTEWPGIE